MAAITSDVSLMDLLDKRSICLSVLPASGREAVEHLIGILAKQGKFLDETAYRKELCRQLESGGTAGTDGTVGTDDSAGTDGSVCADDFVPALQPVYDACDAFNGTAVFCWKSSSVLESGAAAMTVKEGVTFPSMGDFPIRLIFFIAVPDQEAERYTEICERLRILLRNENLAEILQNAPTVWAFLAILDAAEEGRPDLYWPKAQKVLINV